MSLTQQELDRFVKAEGRRAKIEAMHHADVERYERLSRDAMRHLTPGAANSILGALSPMVDAMLMAAGGAVLVLAILG